VRFLDTTRCSCIGLASSLSGQPVVFDLVIVHTSIIECIQDIIIAVIPLYNARPSLVPHVIFRSVYNVSGSTYALRGAFPPDDLRAVCLVLAISVFSFVCVVVFGGGV